MLVCAHALEIVEAIELVFLRAHIFLIGFCGSFEVGEYLSERHGIFVKREQFVADIAELAGDIRVDFCDYSFVVGQLYLECVRHIYDLAALALELAVNIDEVADMQVEKIVVICAVEAALREIDSHERFPSGSLFGSFCLGLGNFLFCLFFCGKTYLEFHMYLSVPYFLILFYHGGCVKKRTVKLEIPVISGACAGFVSWR